jgi:hypothetical protein
MMSQEKPVLVSFRLSSTEKESLRKLAKDKDSNVSDFLRQCINGDTPPSEVKPVPNKDVHMSFLQAQRDELIEDLSFMFSFFQKNAPILDINTGERARLQEILKKVKEMQVRGP